MGKSISRSFLKLSVTWHPRYKRDLCSVGNKKPKPFVIFTTIDNN